MKGTIDALTLTQRIQELRKSKGKTLQAIGDEMGITRQAVSKMENNPTAMSVKNLMAFADAIGCKASDFFVIS